MKHVLFALVVAAPALMAALLLNRANKSLDRVSVLAEEVAQDEGALRRHPEGHAPTPRLAA